jgi:hypothetical protein
VKDLTALHQLLGAYLYEDWYLDYGEPWVAIEAFVRDEPEYAPALRADIRRVLAESTSDSELERRLDKFGLGYAATTAGWESYGVWLQAVSDRVDGLLQESQAD